jgi:hypothetical protein
MVADGLIGLSRWLFVPISLCINMVPMEATPTQIINYFSGFKQNLVPLFQRPYTWGERQWRTLWEDIVLVSNQDLLLTA